MGKILKIMHIEDDLDILEITKMVLGTFGHFELAQCVSGIEALNVVHEFKPDLFLLDSVMPEMDGLETLRELRKLSEFARTPVIFMTGKVQAREVQMYLEAGAVKVITKPFDPTTLADEITMAWKATRE